MQTRHFEVRQDTKRNEFSLKKKTKTKEWDRTNLESRRGGAKNKTLWKACSANIWQTRLDPTNHHHHHQYYQSNASFQSHHCSCSMDLWWRKDRERLYIYIYIYIRSCWHRTRTGLDLEEENNSTVRDIYKERKEIFQPVHGLRLVWIYL
jgi:hypothetical protein